MKDITDSMTMGIVAGLFVGKQLGVFTFTYIAVRLRLGTLSGGIGWGHIYGLAVLSGIGFTMSLFIGSLAFECHDGVCFELVDERMGILMGSLLSGVAGYIILKFQLRKT